MLKILTITLFIISVAFVLKFSVDYRYVSLKHSNLEWSNANFVKNIRMKVYGKEGVEWDVEGKVLSLMDRKVSLESPVFNSNRGDRISARRANVDRETGRGNLEGEVELRNAEIYVRTDRADFDLKNSVISGEGPIYVKEGDRVLRGNGFIIHLKPQRIIIRRVEAEIR